MSPLLTVVRYVTLTGNFHSLRDGLHQIPWNISPQIAWKVAKMIGLKFGFILTIFLGSFFLSDVFAGDSSKIIRVNSDRGDTPGKKPKVFGVEVEHFTWFGTVDQLKDFPIDFRHVLYWGCQPFFELQIRNATPEE